MVHAMDLWVVNYIDPHFHTYNHTFLFSKPTKVPASTFNPGWKRHSRPSPTTDVLFHWQTLFFPWGHKLLKKTSKCPVLENKK